MQDWMRQQSRFCMAVKLAQVMRGFLYQEPLLKSLCHLHSGFETPSGCCRSNYVVLLSVWSSLYSQSLMLCTHKGQGMKSVRLMCLRFVQTIRRCLVPPCWELRQILAVQMSFFHLMSKTSMFPSLALYICVSYHEFALINIFANSLTSIFKRSGCLPVYLSFYSATHMNTFPTLHGKLFFTLLQN